MHVRYSSAAPFVALVSMPARRLKGIVTTDKFCTCKSGGSVWKSSSWAPCVNWKYCQPLLYMVLHKGEVRYKIFGYHSPMIVLAPNILEIVIWCYWHRCWYQKLLTNAPDPYPDIFGLLFQRCIQIIFKTQILIINLILTFQQLEWIGKFSKIHFSALSIGSISYDFQI